MADERKITIVLETTGGGKSGSGDDDDDTGKETPEQEYQKKHKQAIKDVTFKAISTAYNMIESQVSYDVGKYVNLSEDYKTAMLATNVSNTVNVAKSLVGSTLSWAKAGAAISESAGIIGAAVGLTVGIASESLKLIRQYDSQNTTLAINDKASEYAMSRLGLVDNGRGTQN